MILQIIQKDILDAEEPFIAHQCNCCTTRAHGLSEAIFEKYPYANLYVQRKPTTTTANRALTPSVPGTVSVHCAPQEGLPTILNMMGQYGPGKPFYSQKYYPSRYKDDASARLDYFQACLKELEALVDEKDHVAVPYKIGCGLAGGDWTRYETALRQAKTKFVVYQKET